MTNKLKPVSYNVKNCQTILVINIRSTIHPFHLSNKKQYQISITSKLFNFNLPKPRHLCYNKIK